MPVEASKADTNSAGTNATDGGATEGASADRAAQAARIISSSVRWSAAAAVVPVPIVDLVALGSVQVGMVRSLAELYDADASGETLKGVISALLGTLVPTAISTSLLGSSLKLVPGGGSLFGSAGVAAFGAAATYAIGKVFVRHFEGGGTLADFNPAAVEDDLKKEFAAAKAK